MLKDIKGVIFDYGGTILTAAIGQRFCGVNMQNIMYR